MENQKLPNATAVLVLGILSILTCCCYGVVGLALGIIGLVLASKDMKLYRETPEKFINFQNLNVGKILSIIGVVLNALSLIYFIVIISMIGLGALQDPALLQEKIRQMQGL
ncbi:CCC motif membrane protein [Flavobacterium sp.]|uniref:CCC motif membrane protein n=1 Tax=Flavobacterium sp. TaxID=239 RepID=UPI003750ED1D